jgi:hypothetical protein
MIDKLLPDIKAKWPAEGRHETIWIQQDNCRTHIPVDDPEFCAAAQADGCDIRLMCQPANSPDTNVLDLGFFEAIQPLFHRSGMPKKIKEKLWKRLEQLTGIFLLVGQIGYSSHYKAAYVRYRGSRRTWR